LCHKVARARIIAVLELVLIFPAALFMTALTLRNFQPLQCNPLAALSS
jgi:hypothetical protein